MGGLGGGVRGPRGPGSHIEFLTLGPKLDLLLDLSIFACRLVDLRIRWTPFLKNHGSAPAWLYVIQLYRVLTRKIHSVAVKPAAPVHFASPPPSNKMEIWYRYAEPHLDTSPPYPGSMYNCPNHIVLPLHVTPLYIAFIKVLYIILDDFYLPCCSKDSVAAWFTAWWPATLKKASENTALLTVLVI